MLKCKSAPADADFLKLKSIDVTMLKYKSKLILIDCIRN